ncbi:hypothetical protein [Candidatus Villigracilis affinis]|uniref:hypothetical protein n=1 Tax=Candidatus Villigracilis affinis TaxID=3140682 RepID=UPI002A19916C|nr:hypothetical protein [Anaerolineales bacterium]
MSAGWITKAMGVPLPTAMTVELRGSGGVVELPLQLALTTQVPTAWKETSP